MFKRRTPLRWHHHMKEWLWPTAGWSRMAQYLGHRVARISDSSSSIAAGLAFGAAISFTPLIGLHLALSMGIAWAVRANVVAAAIGTLIGNPWTFPLIWLATYKTGVILLGGEASIDIIQFLKDFNIFENPYQTLKPVLAPLLLGSIPYMILVWIAVYFPVWKLVEAKKQKRKTRTRNRQKNDQTS
ncbi:MAG: DUF2062 domain-containing protein [Proteobacteria bacterium]|nr:DUF2062 domain-containing protein [Pseudomonadota bacterium]